MMQHSILFLLKQNNTYGANLSTTKSGLLNSAKLTSSQLRNKLQTGTDIEICVDANDIDKYLVKHRPSICILEAIWATPEKLKQLKSIHKKVKFIVLIHSEVLFLSNEGNAMEFIYGYSEAGITVGFNSLETTKQFLSLGINAEYLPNIYEDVFILDIDTRKYEYLNIGCFGAIRPMKNQLLQAIAAITYANKREMQLAFHVNASRTEQGGESALRNIRALFKNTKHELVEHDWMERKEFLELISTMDLGMQLSVSESFNIVCADFVKMNIPIVVSSSIKWMPDSEKIYGTSIEDICYSIGKCLSVTKKIARKNVKYLNEYNAAAIKVWKNFLDKA
jgi:hypothetical protein